MSKSERLVVRSLLLKAKVSIPLGRCLKNGRLGFLPPAQLLAGALLLEFKNEYQRHKEFSVQGMFPSLIDNFDKIKKPELTEKIRFKSGYNEALWVAKIISHRSLHLDEYIKLIKSDPVWREGLKSYFDPYMHDHVKKKYGLGNYLDRYREQCDVPF